MGPTCYRGGEPGSIPSAERATVHDNRWRTMLAARSTPASRRARLRAGVARGARHRCRRGSHRRPPSTDQATTHAAGVDANDWLAIVNIYRAQSGLQPVAANGSWDAGTTQPFVLDAPQRHRPRRGARHAGIHRRGRSGGQQRQRRRLECRSHHGEGKHRPVDVGPVPRGRHPAGEPDAGVVRAVFQPRPTRRPRHGGRRRRST